MDLTKIEARVRAEEGSLMPIEMEFVLDPDVAVSVVPGKVLADLGIKPAGEATVALGGGEKAVRKVGRAWLQVLDRGAYAQVAWGAPGEEPRLGREAIEACGLVVDPETQIVRNPRPAGE